MFIFTAKLRKGRILAVAVAALMVCGMLVSTPGMLAAKSAAATAMPSPKGIKTNEDRVAYLEQYGWLVPPDPVSTEELTIPKEFDATYTQYLDLQNSQGFDLTKYQGKRVKRYTYAISNYPTGETGIQVGLLVYKNTVIGGEVLSSSLNGFIHGLTYPG